MKDEDETAPQKPEIKEMKKDDRKDDKDEYKNLLIIIKQEKQ